MTRKPERLRAKSLQDSPQRIRVLTSVFNENKMRQGDLLDTPLGKILENLFIRLQLWESAGVAGLDRLFAQHLALQAFAASQNPWPPRATQLLLKIGGIEREMEEKHGVPRDKRGDAYAHRDYEHLLLDAEKQA